MSSSRGCLCSADHTLCLGIVRLAEQSAAVGTFAGGFVLHEFGQGRAVPTVAGAISGAVFGLGLAGVRGRLFDTLFPPGDGPEDR